MLIFVLASNQPGWIQITSPNQAFCEVWFKYQFHGQAFAEVLGSVWHERYPVASLGPGQRFIS